MRFLALDQINFKLPVPIGAILHLDAKVVKTTEVNPEDHADSPSESAHAAKAHVVVTAQVEDVASGVSLACCC
jgi:acyl-coenzyme A thioesterase 9